LNLRCNHDAYEVIELITSYQSSDSPSASEKFLPYASFNEQLGTLTPELVHRYNDWVELIVYCFLLLTCFPVAIILVEAELINELQGLKGTFLQKHWFYFAYFTCCVIPAFLSIKYFCDIRYFLFQGDKVIFQSRAEGRRVYATKDLKFHFLKLSYANYRYQLEVELPDISIPKERRMIILEAAVGRKTMDGILAVLFPLIRGDTAPYLSAKKRHFQGAPEDGETSLWRRWNNIEAHIHVWFLNYKINQILFWIVHGCAEKIFKKEMGKR